jgi:hypothetical protein
VLVDVHREPRGGRTAFQKIAYFATEAGIPTGLEYERGSYGPWSAETKAVVRRLANNALIREDRIGRLLAVKVGPTFDDAARVFEPELTSWGDQIERIADLSARMNAKRAEVAATVHFAAKELAVRLDRNPTEAEVLQEVLGWKIRRRPPLEESEIAEAIRKLAMLGWLSVSASRELPVEDQVLAKL